MAKKDIIKIRDQWLDLGQLGLPNDVLSEVDQVVSPSPIHISLEVVLPKGKEAPDFDFKKNAEIKKLRTFIESKCVDAIKLVMEAYQKDKSGDEEGFKDADSAIKKINGLVKKTLEEFRVALRTAVAKSMGGSTKADDLMTVGSVTFKEFSLLPGAFEGEEEFDSPLLDLSKALKKKKWQYCGVAWNSGECFISIKAKKEFKSSELKELRELLSKGNQTLSGRFRAYSETNVTFQFPEGKRPYLFMLREAMRKQTGKAVNVEKPIGNMDDEQSQSKEKKKSKKNSEESSDE